MWPTGAMKYSPLKISGEQLHSAVNSQVVLNLKPLRVFVLVCGFFSASLKSAQSL